MQYDGKLYGKIGRAFVPLVLTSKDVDKAIEALRQIEKHDGPGFPRGTCARIATEALQSIDKP